MTPVGLTNVRRGFLARVTVLYVVVTTLAIALPSLASTSRRHAPAAIEGAPR